MNRTNTACGRRGSGELRGAPRWTAIAVAVAIGVVGLGVGCDNGGGGGGDEIDAAGPSCDYDESGSADAAADLAIGEATEGYICPKGDEDWYAFSVDQERSILGVSLKMKRKLTDVKPTFQVHAVEEDGSLGEVVANPGSSMAEREVQADFCLDRGDYKMVVRDRGNDDTDLRTAYELKLTTEENPDDAEPNDSREESIALQPEEPTTGYIACRGDVDWYKFDVPDGQIFRFHLEAEKPDYQPKATVYRGENDEALVEVANEASPRKATALRRYVVVPNAGTYYIAVSDDDGEDADASVPYEIRYELIEDADPNEPNDDPSEATEAGSAASCTSSWSTVLDTTGTIGAEGDDDWFRIPLNGCDGGVLEATMVVETTGLSTEQKWKTNENVQAAVTMIRPDTKSSCSDDSECRLLEGRDCTSRADCSGLFESCTRQGKCAGAVECLPEGDCGAVQVQRNHECQENFETCDADSGEDPPVNRAEFAAPIFGGDAVYLRAGDFQGDGAAPERIYSLRVRVHDDPDPNEPNDYFVNSPENGLSPPVHRQRARKIPVYDCAMPSQTQAGALEGDTADTASMDATDSGGMTMDAAVDTDGDGAADATMDTGTVDTGMDTGGGGGPGLEPGCCANKEWVKGAIAYQNDQDWFEYQHPCPGQDCTIRIHYDIEGGPVDTAMNVYQAGASNPWLSAFDVDQKEQQDPRSGTYGGLTSQARCAYAYQGHTAGDGTYYYGLKVGDEVESVSREEVTITNQDSRDWSPKQIYRVCVEKISDSCEEPPCKVYENGCGPPQE